VNVSENADRVRLRGALSVKPALFSALILNLNCAEIGARFDTVCYLREGFSLITRGSIRIVMASLFPVSL
jgi:hypothetical protein